MAKMILTKMVWTPNTYDPTKSGMYMARDAVCLDLKDSDVVAIDRQEGASIIHFDDKSRLKAIFGQKFAVQETAETIYSRIATTGAAAQPQLTQG